PISAYRSTQKSDPALADKVYLWKTPAGPVTRLTGASPNSYGIWKFAENKEGAKAFLRHYAANWVEGFKASTGYNHPCFTRMVDRPMPILSNDPSSHPSDKLSVLQTGVEWHATFGYPGPGTTAADEVVNNYIIPDMMANAATDKMSPKEAVEWAEKEIKAIYRKWAL
ncbi:MAG: carbohydrate ABC transporter substrate-binding protein, partial [Gammaproteobacteria bacterium]|nr:carbohydrate ABC transporter substrate-binding protein [Gammaproteobacteria bacterium]NIT64206.1 carbohydrate ABC transporter substrate-binding protein [Gammaproteobacteria bacterium]NIV21498.1 carbohydrate ABC transporter substrate-binding protein [Gammaproteobacteria bacterium]NIX10037.1 carbohydrate ABC transporter substrate-binding protein [Gammaproteobacteria bacterium]NIY32786.1 carbohydrate ABC transporter substrate-binding protein [Gammaproteobacteria bacterium]